MKDSSRTPVIVSAARTPIGRFLGGLSSLSAPDLGAHAIRAAVARAGIDASALDEVIMGNVVQGGVGQAPARQAAIKGGIPATVPAFTVNKVCGSGLKSVMLAAQAIQCGDAQVVVAGGTENMSRTPYLLDKARSGYRMGHVQVLDHMFYDGLQSPWDGQMMGCSAENTAGRYAFSRAEQDEYAARSVRRAPVWSVSSNGPPTGVRPHIRSSISSAAVGACAVCAPQSEAPATVSVHVRAARQPERSCRTRVPAIRNRWHI